MCIVHVHEDRYSPPLVAPPRPYAGARALLLRRHVLATHHPLTRGRHGSCGPAGGARPARRLCGEGSCLGGVCGGLCAARPDTATHLPDERRLRRRAGLRGPAGPHGTPRSWQRTRPARRARLDRLRAGRLRVGGRVPSGRIPPRHQPLRCARRAGPVRAGGPCRSRTRIGRAWRPRDHRDATSGTRWAIFSYRITPSQVTAPFSVTLEATRNSGVHS